MEVKYNLETARQQLGPDWLQYLVHNKAAFSQNRQELAEQAALANGMRPEATEDDIFLNAEEPVINAEQKDSEVCHVAFCNLETRDAFSGGNPLRTPHWQ